MGGAPASVLGVRAGKCRGSAAPPRVGLTPVCRRLAEAAAGSGGLLEGVKTLKSPGANAVLRYRRCHGSRAPVLSSQCSCSQVESSRTEQVLREVEALLGHSYSSSTPSLREVEALLQQQHPLIVCVWLVYLGKTPHKCKDVEVMPVFSESQAESFPTHAPESTRCRFSCMLLPGWLASRLLNTRSSRTQDGPAGWTLILLPFCHIPSTTGFSVSGTSKESLLKLVAFRGLQRLSPLYGGDQLVQMLGILKPGSQFIAVTDQATYGRKQDFLQRQIKFLPRHFIEILENKQTTLVQWWKQRRPSLGQLPETWRASDGVTAAHTSISRAFLRSVAQALSFLKKSLFPWISRDTGTRGPSSHPKGLAVVAGSDFMRVLQVPSSLGRACKDAFVSECFSERCISAKFGAALLSIPAAVCKRKLKY
ncbi:hypothetical protein Anapl_06931 [Anas platyrhynchos]|uniref:Uncharacterized protein n=1 Tax=Anas platyrhynchos TaxID=8839 RepID=R0LYP2_ANAPL|nr:hypothetical protein Anapl_06931 [Anas platyrhynchos]